MVVPQFANQLMVGVCGTVTTINTGMVQLRKLAPELALRVASTVKHVSPHDPAYPHLPLTSVGYAPTLSVRVEKPAMD